MSCRTFAGCSERKSSIVAGSDLIVPLPITLYRFRNDVGDFLKLCAFRGDHDEPIFALDNKNGRSFRIRAQSSLGKRLHCNDVREPADWQITLKELTWQPPRRFVPRTRSCNRSRRPRASRGRRGTLHARRSRRRMQRTWGQNPSNDDTYHQGCAASDTPSGTCRDGASANARRRQLSQWPCLTV